MNKYKGRKPILCICGHSKTCHAHVERIIGGKRCYIKTYCNLKNCHCKKYKEKK